MKDHRELLAFRVSPEEARSIRSAAKAEDRTLATWLRRAVLGALPSTVGVHDATAMQVVDDVQAMSRGE